jgi:DNA-nicking Smr family endonuclease
MSSTPKKRRATEESVTFLKLETTDDHHLFEKTMRDHGVVPLEKKETENAPPKQTPLHDPTHFDLSPEKTVPSKQALPEKKFSGATHSSRKVRKRRKIKISRRFQPDGKIDLHGCTREVAINKVQLFIETSIRGGFRASLIVTGKGLNSEGERGILRDTIWNWLETRQNEKKFRIQWAPNHLGGKGAILVLF